MDYKEAGVDIVAGEALVDAIKPIVHITQNDNVLHGLGGFGGMYKIPTGYKSPVLVSGTDGVGTKLKLAVRCESFSTIGIDLVAMCVNDIICHGAEPLYFLDYYATGKLKVDEAYSVIEGIATGCMQANMSLIGGETAEMPMVYKGGDFDLAGFAVGIVEEDNIITGKDISSGDQLIGLMSTGLHSNGYSLVNKILESHYELELYLHKLLTPTKIYVKTIRTLLDHKDIWVKGIANITGGGLRSNIDRIMHGHEYSMRQNYCIPKIFNDIQKAGYITDEVMYNTFNMGIGMVVVVDKDTPPESLSIISNSSMWCRLGEVK